ncbi:MAG: hypothetical protein WDN48_10060 [Pseudolabrys sp.]
MMVADAGGLAAGEIFRQERGQHADGAIEDRDLDVLTDAIAASRAERQQYADRRVKPGAEFQHRRAGWRRRRADLTGDVHGAGHSLHQGVRPGAAAEGAAVAERTDVAHHGSGFECRANLVGPARIAVARHQHGIGLAYEFRD